MIYLSYAIMATTVVFLSIKAAKYVDLIDKNSNLSGAFIGGVLLSAVTSLPELLTSISATVWLKNPGLCLSNILGSNLFNITILSTLILFSLNTYKKSKISKSHTITSLFIFIIYIAIILNLLNILNLEIATISITSILILVVYAFSTKFMANDDISNDDEKDEEFTSDLTMKQIIFRFIISSIGLVISSVLITYITDIISTELNLGAGLAGALLLGIATSLPEVTSCISLVKMGNFNLAVGNIVGSNIFNFLVLFIADALYTKGGIYNFSDPQTANLLFFGSIATFIMMLILKSREKEKSNIISSIYPIAAIACYILFLVA